MLESPFFSPEEIITGLLATDVDRVLKAGSLVIATAFGVPSDEIVKAGRLPARMAFCLHLPVIPATFRDPELLARLRVARNVTDIIVALGDQSRGTPPVRSGQGLSLR